MRRGSHFPITKPHRLRAHLAVGLVGGVTLTGRVDHEARRELPHGVGAQRKGR